MMGIGAGISALGSLGAGLFSSSASDKAAQAEAQAAAQALAFQKGVYSDAQNNLAPYMATGSGAANALTGQLPQLTSQFSPTEASLAATPGYQFDLSQGLKSTQNSAAARGLGVSGAALKGASTYATGLADNTLQTQFNIDQTNKTNAYNKLLGTSQLGDTGAYQAGAVGSSTATGASNALMTGAQGQASADVASGTAFNNTLNNLGNYYTTANYQNNGLINRLNLGAPTGNNLFSGAISGIGNAFKSIF